MVEGKAHYSYSGESRDGQRQNHPTAAQERLTMSASITISLPLRRV